MKTVTYRNLFSAGLLFLASILSVGQATQALAQALPAPVSVQQIQSVSFSHESGFYTSSIQLSMQTSVAGAQIRYTTDGTDPTLSSALYINAIPLSDRSNQANILSLIPTNDLDPNDMVYREGWKAPAGPVAKGNVIRARAFVGSQPSGSIISASYFIFSEGQERYSLPLISIITDPVHFFSDETGIYVKGLNNNYFQSGGDWERPIFIEMWETNGDRVFAQDAGARIHGNTTRSRARKSLRIYAKSEYGESWFNYKLFPDKDIPRYKRFILRNGGNDWSEAIFRDDVMSSLLKGTNTDVMYSRPAILFINGEYWGIHGIRDRLDERYVETHYGVDEDDMTMVENEGQYDRGYEGGLSNYLAMIQFISSNSMSIPANYEAMQQKMDIDSYIDHVAANVFFGNTDWPGNNQKMWRMNVPYNPNAMPGQDGLWRWMTYDTDFGFGLNFFYVPGVNEGSQFNSLNLLLTENNNWPNPLWSTLLFRELIKSNEFKTQFINRYQDLLNTVFKQLYTQNRIVEFKEAFDPEIDEHIARWGWPQTKSQWLAEVNRMLTYSNLRTERSREHLRTSLGMSTASTLRINNTSVDNGYVKVNTIDIAPGAIGIVESFTFWEGLYFRNNPVTLEAIPKPGYRFDGWDGPTSGQTDSKISISLAGFTTIRARFVVNEDPPVDIMVPVAHILFNGMYEFTSWDEDVAELTFPPSMVFQQTEMTDPGLEDEMTGPYQVPASDIAPADTASLGFPYRLTTRTRLNGLGEDGISFINTGRGRDLGAAVLALDTRGGMTGATISFTAGTVRPNSRLYAIRLQYRVGTTDAFKDVVYNGEIFEYVRNETEGHEQSFTAFLPVDAIGHPYVQLRWKYYFMGSPTSGPRAMLRLDDIYVTMSFVNSNEDDIAQIPDKVDLLPNYPNPFNPSTNLSYRINKTGPVQLYVYNSLGQRIAELVNEVRSAGTHTVTFDANNLSSGIYMYKIVAEGQILTRKMVLIK